MSSTNERRIDPRVQVQVRLVLTDDVTGQAHVLHTTNLSAGGARCLAGASLVVARDLTGQLLLPIAEGGRSVAVPIAVRARIVRSIPTAGAGFRGTLRDVGMTLEMREADRDELRRFLLEWMAADSQSRGRLVAKEA